MADIMDYIDWRGDIGFDDVYQQTGAFDIPGYLKFGRNRTR